MKKLLIVDDEPNIVMSLEYAFQKQNYNVFIARDGSEALKIMKQEIPDLVILDIMMPQVDGYETIARIKDNPAFAKAKIIFLSAKNKAADIEKGLSLGADLYFTKPFSVKKLITAVNDLIRI
ncbi:MULTISPECIES: response regulator transcription factor [Nonlabens]|uniref:response regulator transcription factor n=1 Tax=Nonlabens TaxID=363408 RepID=UPI000A20AA81|nr:MULTISPECIES: response regulator [Nonlabens]ARN70418.1 response regulator [Nonlabens tegetincola]